MKRSLPLHASHRRARLMLLFTVGVWSLLAIATSFPVTTPTVLWGFGVAVVVTLVNIAMYLYGTVRSYQLLVELASGSTCTACGYELWGSMQAGSPDCPECGQAISDAQRDRIILSDHR